MCGCLRCFVGECGPPHSNLFFAARGGVTYFVTLPDTLVASDYCKEASSMAVFL